MKTKILLLAGIIAISLLPANAQLTVDDSTSREYLINHGHSNVTADIVELSKGAVSGDKTILPVDRKYENRSVIYKWVDKFFLYIDPAYDKGNFMREDIKFNPSVDAL